MKRQNQKRGVSTGQAIAVALCGVLFNTAFAADSAAEHLPAAGFEPMATGKLLQMGFGLFLVLALILVSAWLVRRMGRFQSGTGSPLRVIGGLSMGARERVVLIQAGNTQLLVGVAPGRIQTLPARLDGSMRPCCIISMSSSRARQFRSSAKPSARM